MNLQKRNERDLYRFWLKINIKSTNECWETNHTIDRYGYGYMKWQTKATKVHRIAYCLYNNVTLESIADFVIRHTCDNRRCCNGKHLILGKPEDNTQDQKDRDRILYGQAHGNAIFKNSDIVEIFELSKSGKSNKEIAAYFKCSASTINYIVSGKSWSRTTYELGLKENANGRN